jgi:hypothetical protein
VDITCRLHDLTLSVCLFALLVYTLALGK